MMAAFAIELEPVEKELLERIEFGVLRLGNHVDVERNADIAAQLTQSLMSRPAERAVEPPELAVELLPLDQPGQTVQLVAVVEQVLQTAAVQITARSGGCRRLRTHRKNTGFAGGRSAISVF